MEKMLRAFVEKNLYRDGFRDYLINSFSPVLKEYYLKYDISTYNKLLKKEEQQQLLHKFMEKECSEKQLVATLMETYDVDEAQAKKDVSAVVEKFRKAGILAE